MKKFFTAKTKFWKVMRIGAVQGMIAILMCGIAMAHHSEAQLLEKKVTLSINEVPLEVAIKQISQVTGIKIFYSIDQLDLKEKVSVHADQLSLHHVLDELLTLHHINYRVDEESATILLKKSSQREGVLDESVNRHEIKSASRALITGKVTDATTSLPMPGVNIIIKGTTIGATTDADGKFSIEATDKDVLVFSFIGYVSFVTTVNGRSLINVQLQEDVQSLNEVIVNAGYWEVSEREQTGNISRITSEAIQKQPVSNPLAAMIGRMPGVSITQLTGVPGDGFSVQVRGQNSLRGSLASEPLYVVDGVPFSSSPLSFGASASVLTKVNPLNMINPNDIQSIEVLKDADATSIYGSRGSNGVILITTKKGKAGKTKLDVNVYSGAGKATRLMDLLDTRQYLQMRHEAFANDQDIPTLSNAPDLLRWDTTRYTDWQKTLIGGVAHMTNAQASLSGGSDHTRFLFSAGYNRQSAVFPGDFAYQKGSSLLNLSHSSSDDRFRLNAMVNYVIDHNDLPRTDLTAVALTLAPDAPPVYDSNGKLNWANSTWANPFASLRNKYQGNTNSLNTNINLSYRLIPSLRFITSIGYNTIALKEISLRKIAAQNPARNPLGSAIPSSTNTQTAIIEPRLDFNKDIAQGKLNIIVGATAQQSIRDKKGVFATGYTDDSQLENLAAAAALSPYGVEYSQYRYAAMFGRLNYNWRERYIVNLTARRDGSSRFGPDKQFASFGAIGAAWLFSNEEWLQKAVPFLSFGKLRASIGTSGSDQIGDYQFMDTHTATFNTYQNGKGLIPTRLVNPDFAWEKNKKAEAGLELGFWKDRLMLMASYYRNRTSSQLVGYTLPAITGFSSVQYNLPATVQNSGWELQLNTINITGAQVQWSTSINYSRPRNQLTNYPNLEASSYSQTYKVGESLFIQKRYHSTGVDPVTGQYTFADKDNDGVLDPVNDTQFLKQVAVDYYGGIQNTISYKGFQLDFLFRYVKQSGFNYLASAFTPSGALGSNQPVIVMNRWQKEGDITSIQKFTQSGTETAVAYYNAQSYGDAAISDASFIRLQNASLSYTLPASWMQKLKIDNARIYLQGQNLLTITNYKGSDPETQSLQTLPPLRIYTMGIQLTL